VLDVEEEKASVVSNVSAGGTRYIVNLKSGLKFYGQQSAASLHDNNSLSGGGNDGFDNLSIGHS
jgi:hypothetical protein